MVATGGSTLQGANRMLLCDHWLIEEISNQVPDWEHLVSAVRVVCG